MRTEAQRRDNSNGTRRDDYGLNQVVPWVWGVEGSRQIRGSLDTEQTGFC